MKILVGCAAMVALMVMAVGGAASAEAVKISDRGQFMALVGGKTLSRPLVQLSVGDDGTIRGSGAGWDVTGSWTWDGGYFCRDLNWGGDELGYNCQEVVANGNRVSFTSDKGAGDSAAFTLN